MKKKLKFMKKKSRIVKFNRKNKKNLAILKG
jgi:hypothetical protein